MLHDFKIHCIALTKNEADIIGLCLSEATKWADFIYVYDGESTDSTWEIVQQLQCAKIIPWKQDGKVFREGLRSEVFEEFRHNSSYGDWWIQLNVDEFYPENPRAFFWRIPARYDFVWGINVEYCLTQTDLENLDFSLPFEQNMPLLRYYKVVWSEPRAFRYRPRLRWTSDAAWPQHAGLVAPERIVFKHYPHRSPSQIQMRLDVRRDNRARGFHGWEHAQEASWQNMIVSAASCHKDDGRRPLVIQEDRLPNHLESPSLRVIKRLLHGTHIWP